MHCLLFPVILLSCLAEVLQEDFARVGARAKIIQLEWAAHLEAERNDKCGSGKGIYLP